MMGGWMMAGFGILLLLAVGLAVVVLLRPSPGAGRGILRPSAKELVDQRYARGESDDDEYYRRLSASDSTEPMTRTSATKSAALIPSQRGYSADLSGWQSLT